MTRIKHIDGLRAVAIIAVVLYHAFPKIFPNGYLGVDYFLVISGFVISKKYFVEIKENFSFKEFWSKRISRLYPQMLTCVGLCLPIAWMTMHPDHLENFSQSAIATLIGANNILLYLKGGYWNFSNELKPLFTTWSLGLEEQFYFLVAITFSFFQSFKISRELIKKIFLLLFFISLIASGFGAIYFQRANYLLLVSRFWEFAIGIYAAFLVKKNLYWITNSITNISFLVIVISSIGIPIETSRYAPNPFLLIPLIAVLVICVSENKSVSTYLLSSKVFVYIGLSSYAIYLYHQPMLAFAKLKTFNGLTNLETFYLVLLSFLLGFLMYELIEKRGIFYALRLEKIYSFKPKILLLLSGIILLINIPIFLNKGFFALRFPYMLVDGKPPAGFLGGKGYTDHPFIYLEKKFPEINNEQIKNKVHQVNILLFGNSITRDLINTLEIIDSRNSEIRFNYSYYSSLIDEKEKEILEEADIIIIQVENNGNSEFKVEDKLLGRYKNFSNKIIWYKAREKFAKNITPVIFKKHLNKRANFKIENKDSYYCSEIDVMLTKFASNSNGLAILDSQCAFNDQNGMKILTSKDGQVYTFDGIHLSYAGAERLANILTRSNIFNKIFGL